MVKRPRRNRSKRTGSHSTVLIVDDDDAFRKVLRTLFASRSGFDVCVEARDSVDAIKKAKLLSPSLAVLDFSMPEMDGLQLARKLKELAPELPMFMLTADYDSGFEKKALSCGITSVFSKLDDLGTLVANARAACGIDRGPVHRKTFPPGHFVL
jgi:DNA-binding NarL/FixJ family response regulator